MQRLLEEGAENVGKILGEFISYILFQLARAAPMLFTLFLRRNFGEGYCQPLTPLFGMLYLGWYLSQTILLGWAASFLGGGQDPWVSVAALWLYGLTFMGLCVVHGWRHWARFMTDGFLQHHSQWDGDPWLGKLFPKLKPWQVKMFIEPVLVCGLGLLSGPMLGWMFGMFFFLGGVGLFAYEVIGHGVWRTMICRYIDHGIEAQHTGYVLKHHIVRPAPTPPEAWQQVIRESFVGRPTGSTVSMHELAQRLDPKLRDLIFDRKAKGKPSSSPPPPEAPPPS